MKTNAACHVAALKALTPVITLPTSDRGSEWNFAICVRLVWCCISHTLQQLHFKHPHPNTSQPRGIYCETWTRRLRRLLSLVRGEIFLSGDGYMRSDSGLQEQIGGGFQSILEVILLLIHHLSVFWFQCCCKWILQSCFLALWRYFHCKSFSLAWLDKNR